MSIQTAVGHDNAAGLQALDPQPVYSGRKFAKTVNSPEGTYRDGEYVVFTYPIVSPAQFTTLLARMGLTSAESRNITVRLPLDDLTTFANYNAQVERGRKEQPDGDCYRNVEFVVRFIEAI